MTAMESFVYGMIEKTLRHDASPAWTIVAETDPAVTRVTALLLAPDTGGPRRIRITVTEEENG